MFEEFGSNVFVGGVFGGEFESHGEHGGAEERHPRCAVGLLERLPVGQRLRAVEDADVVETEEAAGEDLLAGDVLTVDPPGKVDDAFLEDASKEKAVALAVGSADL